MRRFTSMLSSLALATTIAGGLAIAPSGAADAAAAACTDPSNLCLTPSKGAKWQPGKKSTRKDRKRRGRGAAGTLALDVENGRGSLFINGRYAGTAPLTGKEIPAGKNDIQVRDGMIVLAEGLLTVPKGGTLTVTVRHP